MKQVNTTTILAVAAILLSAAPSMSATLKVDGGQLVGATGVLVGDSFFDVDFVEGSCTDLFTGCDENSDFAFNSREDAEAASLALDQQVFVGIYDTDPSLTTGINSTITSQIWTPFAAFGSSYGPAVSLYVLFNTCTTCGGDGLGGDFATLNIVSSFNEGLDEYVFARWTPATTPVPLPAGAWFLLTAIAGFGGLRILANRLA